MPLQPCPRAFVHALLLLILASSLQPPDDVGGVERGASVGLQEALTWRECPPSKQFETESNRRELQECINLAIAEEEEPTILLNGDYLLAGALHIKEDSHVVIRAKVPASLICEWDDFRHLGAAFVLSHNTTLVLEGIVISKCAADQDTTWTSRECTEFGNCASGAIEVIGSQTTLVLDRVSIVQSRGNAVLVQGPTNNIATKPNVFDTSVIMRHSSIQISLQEAIMFYNCGHCDLLVDAASEIVDSASGAILIENGAKHVTRITRRSKISKTGKHAVYLANCRDCCVVLDHESTIELAGYWHPEKLGKVGLKPEAASAIFLIGPYLSVLIDHGSEIKDSVGGCVHSLSLFSKISLNHGSAIRGCRSSAIMVIARSSVVSLTHGSLISETGGTGLYVSGGRNSVLVSSGSAIRSGRGDAMFVEGFYSSVTISEASVASNSGTALKVQSPGGNVSISDADFRQGLHGVKIAEFDAASIRNTVFDFFTGASIWAQGEYLLTDNVSIIDSGNGMMVDTSVWHGSDVQTIDSHNALILFARKVNVSRLRLLTNFFGIKCGDSVQGEITGEIYFSQRDDIDPACLRDGSRLKISSFVTLLPPYPVLESITHTFLGVGLCGALVVAPLRRKGSRVLVALVAAVWAVVFCILLTLKVLFHSTTCQSVHDQLQRLQVSTLFALCLAVTGGIMSYRTFLRRVSVFYDAQVDAALRLAREVQFPFVLMEAPRLLEQGAFLSHEDARQKSLLRFLDTMEQALDFFKGGALSVFFSHQWLSNEHPDPDGVQYRVVCDAICALALRGGQPLEDFHAWIDYHSIPQRNQYAQRLAINSLPIYASCLHMFVIVAPESGHRDTGLRCNKDSYQRRGWCRAEQLCHWAYRGTSNLYLADDVGLHPLHEACRDIRWSFLANVVPQASENTRKTLMQRVRKSLGGVSEKQMGWPSEEGSSEVTKTLSAPSPRRSHLMAALPERKESSASFSAPQQQQQHAAAGRSSAQRTSLCVKFEVELPTRGSRASASTSSALPADHGDGPWGQAPGECPDFEFCDSPQHAPGSQTATGLRWSQGGSPAPEHSGTSTRSSASRAPRRVTIQNSDGDIELSRWFAQAIYVFAKDAEFSCCRMKHTLDCGDEIPCDREALMLPILGLYANIFRERDDERFAELYNWISQGVDSVFPSAILYTTRRSTEERELFGDLVYRLERRLVAEAATAGGALSRRSTSAQEAWRNSAISFSHRRASDPMVAMASGASTEGSLELEGCHGRRRSA